MINSGISRAIIFEDFKTVSDFVSTYSTERFYDNTKISWKFKKVLKVKGIFLSHHKRYAYLVKGELHVSIYRVSSMLVCPKHVTVEIRMYLYLSTSKTVFRPE